MNYSVTVETAPPSGIVSVCFAKRDITRGHLRSKIISNLVHEHFTKHQLYVVAGDGKSLDWNLNFLLYEEVFPEFFAFASMDMNPQYGHVRKKETGRFSVKGGEIWNIS